MRASVAIALVALLGAPPAQARSVDPAAWAQSDLVRVSDGAYAYDHHHFCSMRDDASKRALVHVAASGPTSAISRDQFVALIQRLEAVILLGLVDEWQPGLGVTQATRALDCRHRVEPADEPQRHVAITVADEGFTVVIRSSGSTIRFSETWVEAFRP